MPQQQVAFVSDLHLFSDRSVADSFYDQIVTAVKSNDAFVLGGDIFDFKWNRFGSMSTAYANAGRWLRELIEFNGDCKFHFLLGNHDCTDGFVAELESLTESHPNFSYQPFFLVLADCLFLHGDVIDCRPNSADLQRCRHNWAQQKQKPVWQNSIYNLVVATRIHRTVARTSNPSRRVSKKLMAYMDDVGLDQTSINRVFYGHTHWQDNFSVGQLEFRNGGAAIKGLPFEIIDIEINS